MSKNFDKDDTAFPDGPEFWFDQNGVLWLGHECIADGESFDREYTLPGSIYEISTKPVSVLQIISCGLCKIRGRIVNGEWQLIEG